jgi:hypothetical protein
MNFLHRELNLSAGDIVEVILDNAANVQLLDPANYAEYRAGRSYRYSAGGYAKESPAQLEVPTTGTWHLTVDLGGGIGRVRASYRVLTAQPA